MPAPPLPRRSARHAPACSPGRTGPCPALSRRLPPPATPAHTPPRPRLNRTTLDFIRDGAEKDNRRRLHFSAAADLAEIGHDRERGRCEKPLDWSYLPK
jgi:hypothetical protein